MKKRFKVFLCISSFLALNFLCKGLTDDFCTDFLIPPAKAGSKWDFNLEPENLENLLSQKYTYLSKGKQSYVFLSEDQEHVLKIFKPLPPFWEVHLFGKTFHIGFGKLPFAKSLCIDYDSTSFKETQELEFLSYQNSLFLFREKTLLEYLHLARTHHFQKKLHLYDKIGVLHLLDLNTTSFLIQKKIDLLYPTLSKLLENKETENVKILLNNFVDFYLDFIQSNIVRPTTLEKNIGCIDLKPIQIDVGRVLTAENIEAETVSYSQIYHSTSHMRKWLKVKAPDFCSYLDEIIEEKLKEKRP